MTPTWAELPSECSIPRRENAATGIVVRRYCESEETAVV